MFPESCFVLSVIKSCVQVPFSVPDPGFLVAFHARHLWMSILVLGFDCNSSSKIYGYLDPGFHLYLKYRNCVFLAKREQ